VAGLLSVVATPIGNLDDLSPRAARALTTADVIACEDTRVTRKLLTRAETHARLVRYDAVSEERRTPEIVRMVEAGRRVALVTDAGTPGVSDPGYRLVAACAERGLRIEVIPGPSAVTAALVLSGLPSARFVFEGFLPRTTGARRRRLELLRDEERTIVLFEAPHRIAATLQTMVEVLGDRQAALARELTKVHEEVLRAPLSLLAEQAREGRIRGEITLVIAGAEASSPAAAADDLVTLVRERVEAGASTKDAVAAVAAESGVPRRAVYQAAIDAGL
jgi:16S rRNA (cytidine1402-2'-O)-methyltransferase